MASRTTAPADSPLDFPLSAPTWEHERMAGTTRIALVVAAIAAVVVGVLLYLHRASTERARVAREEEVKRKRYEQLCKEQRGRTFIPVVMSSYGAPGAGMRKMVAIMSERLQRIDGGTTAGTKRRILRCLQAKTMREIARNGLEALNDQRVPIMKERERRERMRGRAGGRSPPWPGLPRRACGAGSSHPRRRAPHPPRSRSRWHRR